MNGIVGKLLSNPHTTGAGGAFAIITILREIALAWAPTHEKPIRITAEGLQALSALYGFSMAGDAGKSGQDLEALKKDVKAAIETGNTDMLAKKDLPLPVEPPKPAP